MTHGLRRQRTLNDTAVITGFGYWSGQDIRVELHPAEPNTGIVFVRWDLGEQARVAATLKQRIESPRRPTLRRGITCVEMVEHVLAGLAGMHVDNCEVRVDAAEMPGCDGSSLAIVEAIQSVGTQEQDAWRNQLVIQDEVRVGDETSYILARPAEAGRRGLYISVEIDYRQTPSIGHQAIDLKVTPETFLRELADSRTFILKEEAQWLQSQGLAQRPTARDLLIFDEYGPIDNKLRHADECVRHKALDLVGDLALAGCDVVGTVVAHCSGHRLNAGLVKALMARTAESKRGTEHRRIA